MFSRRMVLAIAGVFFVFCCIILVSISERHPDATEEVGAVPISIISPFQDLVTGSMNAVRDVWRHYFFLVATAKENEQLKKMLSQAVERNNQCIETELSNQRLRKFLHFQDTMNLKIVLFLFSWFHLLVFCLNKINIYYMLAN